MVHRHLLCTAPLLTAGLISEPESLAACSSTWETDTDYHNGQGLGHDTAESAADCCEKCTQFPGCYYFTYYPPYAGSECWFKDSNGGHQTKVNATSGGTGVEPPTTTTTTTTTTPWPYPADTPVQVYIMMGQSNMVGMGSVSGDKDGTLEYAVKTKHLYPYLLDEAGDWAVRKDVRNVFIMGNGNAPFESAKLQHNEYMTVTGNTIGVEFGVGHNLGNFTDGPVMILKSCIGNRALGWDLLPPGSEEFEYTDSNNVTWVYAGYHDSPDRWQKGTEPQPIGWMAGEQYDGDTNNVKQILANLHKYYPGATNYEVAGFLWWQGDRDSRSILADHYEKNLVHLIKTLRKDFNAPKAKFVTASLGQTEKGATDGGGKVLDAMLAVDGKSGKYPEFEGNVAAVYTHPLSKGGSSGGHYNHNAETYMNVGEAMGTTMVELLKGSESAISV